MNVQFYTHKKRNNSLKLPTDGVIIACALKDNCSVTSPVLELKTEGYPAYNYAYIPDFARYYYVNDWFFLKYFPARIRNVGEDAIEARNLIWAFKDNRIR